MDRKAAYLQDLNPAQRGAVEYGVPEGSGALLIVAGAGTGKTKTLAHRVAHLVLNGADPRRILLLTFTRRAAAEMTRRAQRILGQAVAVAGSAGAPANATEMTWSGTFHGVGNRLLRIHAHAIGLDPSFTVLDRSDAADLMNLVRSDLGLAKKRSRFPKKDTCLAIYSHAVNSGHGLGDTLDTSFPWCADWSVDLKELFRAYVTAKQRDNVRIPTKSPGHSEMMPPRDSEMMSPRARRLAGGGDLAPVAVVGQSFLRGRDRVLRRLSPASSMRWAL